MVSSEKWLNVEITAYAKIESGSNELLQLYSRRGHQATSALEARTGPGCMEMARRHGPRKSRTRHIRATAET
jgi:hypothetical protein